jgi:hypothetical protein
MLRRIIIGLVFALALSAGPRAEMMNTFCCEGGSSGGGSGGGGAALTFDPANKGSAETLSNGNLTATSSAGGSWNNSGVLGTIGHSVSDGRKFYFEITPTLQGTAAGFDAGIGNQGYGYNVPGGPGSSNPTSVGFRSENNECDNNSCNSGYWNGIVNGNVFALAMDTANGAVWASNCVAGVHHWSGVSGNPATNTGGRSLAAASMTGTVYPLFAEFDTNGAGTIRNSSFVCAVPSGFVAW